MTTIAYKDGIMAGDTLHTRGGVVMSTIVTKIWRSRSGWLIGLTGYAGMAPKVEAWVENDCANPPPTFAKRSDDGSEGELLVVKPNGQAGIIERHGEWFRVDEPAATGSGYELALGAMAAGASAAEAVQIAMRYDRNSGGEVQVVMLEREATQAEVEAAEGLRVHLCDLDIGVA